MGYGGHALLAHAATTNAAKAPSFQLPRMAETTLTGSTARAGSKEINAAQALGPG